MPSQPTLAALPPATPASRSVVLAIALLSPFAGQATDTAFWQPYASDEKTYALIHFDEPAPLAAGGKGAGEGTLTGGAQLTPDGKFGGALRLDGAGSAVFTTTPFDPKAMAIHPANRSFSVEAWIKLDRLPTAGETAPVLFRPDNGGQSIGFALTVDAEGALEMTVKPLGSRGTAFKSQPDAVPAGEWVHVAGISNHGFLSVGRDKLYVNGVEIFDGPASEAAGYTPETQAADLHIGGTPDGKPGFAGVIDAVRIHSLVGKFWPPEPMPWRSRIAADGLPTPDKVLAAQRQAWLTFPFEGQARPLASTEVYARDPAIVDRFKVDFKGEFVPGVVGLAARGRLSLSGFPLAEWGEGSFDFWARPYGVNSVSDRQAGIFESSAFAVYFHNSVGANRALSFYYKDAEGRLRMNGDGLGTEIHPGRWVHLAFTWDADRVVMYVDGQPAASDANKLTTEANKGLFSHLIFNNYATNYEIDELAFYEHALTAAEVANRHWSYVAPEKMTTAKAPAPIRLDAWRFPSENAIFYRMIPGPGLEGIAAATLRLKDGRGREILAVERPFSEHIARLETPPLPAGIYAFAAAVTVGGQELNAEPIHFLVKEFPWEGNILGITDEVFPPFTPVKTAGDTVSVVLRDYRMNGFGLWDSVVSQGRELLAAPIRLRYETANGGEGEGAWTFAKGTFEAAQPHLARYRAKATSETVAFETVSEIEMDGMMKVTLTLKPGGVAGASSSANVEPGSRPGSSAHSLTRLWLEIPLKAAEAPLMHEDTGTMRNNYSGTIPAGQGTVWQARRRSRGAWRNAFCGYLWLGGEERGIAWFAENDKGWITKKGLSDRPLQEIVRESDRVVLRVYLIDLPTAIEAPRQIVFGLQASPVKPMPEDWRTGARGGGLPVTPWGGHQCADKFPFEDRWEIVDKIVEQQTTDTNNSEWFKTYRQEHDIPPLRGTEDWLKSVGHFAGYPNYRQRPTLTYFEEMAASTYRPEWHAYKDEWSRDLLDSRRPWPDGYDLFRQGKLAGGAYRVNFGPSYRDYGAWYANEWLKRGVGIYWDNSYLTTSTNPLTSAAYLAEDGQIQPALTLWNQRDYSKRTWNLLRHWERQRGEKLLFLQHMTNASLLPILAWSITAMDNEFSARAYARNVEFPKRHDSREPFPPDYLRAQSLGRQTGNYPVILHAQFAFSDFDIDPPLIPKAEMDRPNQPGESIYSHKRNWGMCRVHDIPGGGFPAARLESALRGFGYGTPDVVVHNYWAEKPVLKVDDDNLKWLVVARPAEQRLFVILQSWSRQPGKVKVAFDYDAIGFRPQGSVVNLETGAVVGLAEAASFELGLDAAYDLRVLGVGTPPLPDGVYFADDFANGASPRWNYLSSFLATPATVEGGRVLRLAENRTSWQGPSRLELWDGVDDWQNGTLEITFRPSATPAARTSLFTIITRAGKPAWSQYGLSHTRLANGQFLAVFANPEKNVFEIERWTVGSDGKRGRATLIPLGPLGEGAHTLAIAMQGANTQVQFDGTAAADFADTPQFGAAFGLHGGKSLSDNQSVDLLKVEMRKLRR